MYTFSCCVNHSLALGSYVSVYNQRVQSLQKNKNGQHGCGYFVLKNGRHGGCHFFLKNGRHDGGRHSVFANFRDRPKNSMATTLLTIMLNQPEAVVSLHVKHEIL